MTQPAPYDGRFAAPPPGAHAPERRIARVRGHARRLVWSALILIAVCGATGYYYDNLPAPFENVMLLAAAGVVVVALVIFPWLVWLGRSYTITTRRVIARSGVFARVERELLHARGYEIRVRRGPIQRLWRAGTLTLDNGVDSPLRMVDIPSVALVHEVLVDQVEVGQILAHRDARSATGATDMPLAPPPPPPPPLPGR